MQTYFTNNAGLQSFKVEITDRRVAVYRERVSLDNDEQTHDEIVMRVSAEKIFIGKSVETDTTRVSECFGDQYDGNSILLCINECARKYIHIGANIVEFTARDVIDDFRSPVDGDMTYPVAFDTAGRAYLLIEDVVLAAKFLRNVGCHRDTIYMNYYDRSHIEVGHGDFEGVVAILMKFDGVWPLGVNYQVDTAAEYDRMTKRGPMLFKYADEAVRTVGRDEYIEFIERFGESLGASQLGVTTLIACP